MGAVLETEVADQQTGGNMMAARVHAVGPPGVISIERIQIPEPGEGEILVRVAAAGVGPWDALVRTGKAVCRKHIP